MKINELKAALKKDTVERCYFIYGEEDYLLNMALNELKKCPGIDFPELNIQEMQQGCDFSDIVRALDSPPFMSTRRIVFCDIADIDSDAQLRLSSFLPDIPEFSTLVVVKKGKADRRKVFEKELLKTAAVECSLPGESDTVDYILSYAALRLKKISRNTASFFLSYVDDDMGAMMTELDKLICVCESEISLDDVKKYCVRADTFNVFLLHGLMLDGRLKEAKDLLDDILRNDGSAPLGLLSLIYSNFDLMLMARACFEAGYPASRTVKAIVDSAGVKSFRAESAVKQCANMNSDMIRRSISMLADADYKVKHGEMDISGDLFGTLLRVYHIAD